MSFSPDRAEMRFGCGLSPYLAPPADVSDILDGLMASDEMAKVFPIETFSQFRVELVSVNKLRAQARKERDNVELRDQIKARNRAAVAKSERWFANTMLRWAHTPNGFRERLVAFWGDHFTAKGKQSIMTVSTSPYLEEAIRPNITGRFGDLLVATTTHPLMLHFLDQNISVGPDSRIAKRHKRLKGLNENLAREVLELHTLGVDGPYTQDDVRQLAELFTGMTFNAKDGFVFRDEYGQPGSETVMGRRYGGDPARLEPILQSLQDLAVHPVTARHIAQKLAVHFVSDQPDPALVDHVAQRFEATGGDLMAVYQALLEHPAAWNDTPSNVKPSVDFIASAWRALAVRPAHVKQMKTRDIRRVLVHPLRVMGQPWQRPNGPDGWSEDDTSWVTPQGVSARLRWAMSVPQLIRPDLPDPRDFVASALGARPPEPVRFAAAAAESRSEAIGLVLASPAFQRR
ncbi:MAG: DUF1800 family protein [Sedimentitalea sp.]